MGSPPVLVSKGNVMIGYNPIYEFSALPDTAKITEAVRRAMNAATPSRPQVKIADPPEVSSPPLPQATVGPHTTEDLPPATASEEIVIKVPVMGEGIRSARIVALLKKPGDPVALDDALCEVETDKAVYPIQSSHAGVFREWRVQIDDAVEIGRDIAAMEVRPSPVKAGPGPNADRRGLQKPPPVRQSPASPAPSTGAVVEPALPMAILRRLNGVIPTNLQRDALWKAIREAREICKMAGRDVSPSLMVAWCVAQAMKKHAAFRRMVQRDGTITETTDFDLGIAVALPGDRLAAAPIHDANRPDWPAFAGAYAKAVADARDGRVDEIQAPVNLTTLGAFGIERATPIVVPPAMATLFVGRAHEKMINDGGAVYPVEVATLSLTFDHRVVNGVGAAAFVEEVRMNMENFLLPQPIPPDSAPFPS
jgi:pyruvate/2-oxoglutarate dehydrogenase complex dihydrolipoamide acyltransferase (E2) component